MAGNKDINNRRALGWKKPNISKIEEASIPSSANKTQLLNGIRSLVQQQVKILYGDKSQQKYRNIVELLMTRIKSDINLIEHDAFTEDDVNEMTQSIQDALKKNDATKLKLNEYAQTVIDYLNQKLKERKAAYANEEADANGEHAYDEVEKSEDDETASTKNPDTNDAQRLDLVAQSKYASTTDFNIQLQKKFDELQALCSGRSMSSFEKNEVTSVEYLVDSTSKLDEKQNTSKDSGKKQKKKPQEQDKDKEKQKNSPVIVDSSLHADQFIAKYPEVFKNVNSSLANLAASIAMSRTYVNDDIQFNAIKSSAMMHASWDMLMQVADRVYKLVDKSLFSKIIEFIGDMIKRFFVNKLLAPFKSRLWKDIAKKFQPLVDHIKQFFRAMRIIRRIMTKEFSRLAKRVWRFTKRIFGWFTKMFKPIISGIRMLLSGLVKAVQGIFRGVFRILSLIWRGISAIGRLIKSLFSKTTIGKLFGKIGRFMKNAANFVMKSIKTLFKAPGKVFKAAKGFITKAFNAVKTKIANAAKGIAKGIAKMARAVAKGVVKGIKTVVKGTLKAIAKKLGLNIGKKVAKKKALSLLMTGAKKIMKFFKKWVLKIIAKLAMKIGGAVAANAVPLLGQIVSICMMLYTIYDTIKMFYDVYKFMKDNPPAWEFMKEQVAKWAAKAFNFIKDMCDFGKKLFIKIFIDGPKKLAKMYTHAWNFIFNPISTIKNKLNQNKYEARLISIKNDVFMKLNLMKPEEKIKYIKDHFDANTQMLDKQRALADELTEKITAEEDSWWPDQEKIADWTKLRQSIFEKMMRAAAEIGLDDFSKETQAYAVSAFKEAEKKEAEIIEAQKKMAEQRKELTMKYENKHIDLKALKDICAGYKSQSNEYANSLKSFCTDIKNKGKAMIRLLDLAIDGFDDEEENSAIAVV